MRLYVCYVLLANAVGVISLAGCAKSYDIFAGPAVAIAMKRSRAVRPGHLARTAFTANDVADLVGVDGASFIVRLPDSAPLSNRVYYTVRRFVDGKPDWALQYDQVYQPKYQETTRCWLIDLGIFADPFRPLDEAPRVVLLSLCFKSLDGTGQIVRSRRRLQLPECKEAAGVNAGSFMFTPTRSMVIETGKDIAIGCWHQMSQQVRQYDGPLGAAQASPLAYVAYVRFQHEQPSGLGPRSGDSKEDN